MSRSHLLCLSWVVVVTSIGLASACGGSSFTSGGEGGEGGGGTGKGGSQATAGTSSGAGKPQGGSGSGGGSAGGSGPVGGSSTAGSSTAGSSTGGSPSGAACTAPADSGPCEAAFPRWFHDPSTGLCRPFVYGGCQGNENNYESLADCQAACAGGEPDYDACSASTDCEVGGLGCCGICDGPGLTAHDLIAYASSAREKVYQQCSLVDIACAPCAVPPPEDETLKYFVPDCVRGACVVEDLRTSRVTACETADDCHLRHGSGCCEACGGDNLIAISDTGAFQDLVCGDLLPPCAACEPTTPSGVFADCVGGHCRVQYLAGTNAEP